MTEFHEIDDDGESAAEFLRKMSRKGAGAPERKRPPGAGRRAAYAAETRGLAIPPWIAASCSLLVWGSGQLLSGRFAVGILFLSLQGLVVALVWSLRRTWESWVWLANLYSVEPIEIRMGLLIAGVLVPVLWLGGALEAYAQAARHPRARVYAGPSIFPALASAVLPGWGQILNDQPGKAGIFLTIAGFAGYVVGVALRWPELWTSLDRSSPPLPSLALPAIPLFAAAACAVAWVIAVVDAFWIARKERE